LTRENKVEVVVIIFIKDIQNLLSVGEERGR
jgi:hypothetical protein